jgi:hypothetical protein
MADELRPGEFPSWRSYWDFARSVRRDLRFVRTPGTEHFLECVLQTSKSRQTDIPAKCIFWRAQLGHDWRQADYTDDEIPCAYPAARMKPRRDLASDGRANPRGIPCLYLATTKETAMSEVRPWIGSYVSVGQFRTRRRLTIVDCARSDKGFPFHFDEPEPMERSETVWTYIDRAFAEPMTRGDESSDYVPTQILAELFKRAGLDGVVYRSNFGESGFNIALFNPEDADLINCGLFKVKDLQPEFTEADTFYFVEKTGNRPNKRSARAADRKG